MSPALVRSGILFAFLAVGPLLAPVSAQAAVPEKAREVAESLGLGEVNDAVERDGTWYLALRRGGVTVVDTRGGASKRTGQFAEGKHIVRLALTDRAVVVVEQREEALAYAMHGANAESYAPLSLAEALSAPLTATASATDSKPNNATSSTASNATGQPGNTPNGVHVSRIDGARIHLSEGQNSGLRVGQRFRIESPGRRAVVVALDETDADSASARLGRGESVPSNARAFATNDDVTSALMFSPPADWTMRWGMHVRPFLGLDARTPSGRSARAGGAMADLFFVWKLPKVPLVLDLGLEPVGLAVGTGERHLPGAATAVLAYSTDYLEVGLGVGALFGREGPCSDNFGSPTAARICADNTSGTVNQTIRLGAVDGLHLSWRSSIASQESRFVFGSGRGELQVPVSSSLAIFGAGGGSRTGWAFGDLGVRSFLRGTGGSGSLIVSATAGVASVSDGEFGGSVTGPSVGLGLEWRR